MNLDTVTGLELQIKRPGEFYPFTFEFSNLNTAETIVSVTGVSQVNRGLVSGSVDLTISGLAHDSAQNAQAWVGSGTDGEYYCLTCTVVTSTGATRTCSGVVWVKQAC